MKKSVRPPIVDKDAANVHSKPGELPESLSKVRIEKARRDSLYSTPLLSPADVDFLIRKLKTKKGDQKDGRILLAHFCLHSRVLQNTLGGNSFKPLLKYITDRLRLLALDEESGLQELFGLPKKKVGRQHDQKTDRRNLQIAIELFSAKKDGAKLEAAINSAMGKFKMSKRMIEKIYSSNKAKAETVHEIMSMQLKRRRPKKRAGSE